MNSKLRVAIPLTITLAIVAIGGVYIYSLRTPPPADQVINAHQTSQPAVTAEIPETVDSLVDTMNIDAETDQRVATGDADADAQAIMSADDATLNKVNQTSYDLNF